MISGSYLKPLFNLGLFKLQIGPFPVSMNITGGSENLEIHQAGMDLGGGVCTHIPKMFKFFDNTCFSITK